MGAILSFIQRLNTVETIWVFERQSPKKSLLDSLERR